MIGHQKRPLEHTVSSQPVKYQKHCDDKLCEANTRVALGSDCRDFQQHYSDISQKSPFPISPVTSCDSVNVFERGESPKVTNQDEGKVPLESETVAKWNAHPGGVHSGQWPAVTIADDPGVQNLRDSKNGEHEEDPKHSNEASKKNLGEEKSLEFYAIKDKDKLSSFLPIPSEDNRSTSREPSIPRGNGNARSLQGFQGLASQTPCRDVGEGDSNYSRRLVSETICDLNVMHERVQSFGGYETVTSEGKWGTIAEALGLESDCGPGLKLVDFKFLRSLERQKRAVVESECDGLLIHPANTSQAVSFNEDNDAKGENHSVVSGEQFAESEPFPGKSVLKSNRGHFSPVRRDDDVEFDNSKAEFQRQSLRQDRELPNAHFRVDGDQGSRTDGYQDSRTIPSDTSFFGPCGFSKQCDEFRVPGKLSRGFSDHNSPMFVYQRRENGTDAGNLVIVDNAVLEKDNKSLADTVTWIKRMALDPGNPYMGQGPDGTSQNQEWVTRCASRAWKVRALLFWKRRNDPRCDEGNSNQLRQILAPSHYYEDVHRHEHQSIEKLRACRERVVHYGCPTGHRSLQEPVSFQRGSSSLAQPQLFSQAGHRLPRQSHFYLEERFSDDTLERPRKRIPVGPDYQASILIWKSAGRSSSAIGRARAEPSGDETQSSDEEDEYSSRFLGTQVWPPQVPQRITYRDQLGQGRPLYCNCLDAGSLNCVRLHIFRERDRLKQELGQAFYDWKFDQMGESVADNWKKDEEQTFRTLVKTNPPSQEKNFWDQLPDAYPDKKMKDLVSYYFNVFVFRRRAVQNRLDPQHIDSDDDETDLPDGVTDESEDYESGEEVDEEAYEDGSEEEHESDKQDLQCVEVSAKSAFCEFQGVNMVYSRKIGVPSTRDNLDVPKGLGSTSLRSLEIIQRGFHEQEEERSVGHLATQSTSKWRHDHNDDEKHLQEPIPIVGEEDLQEVKTWEVSHWDEADHEDLVDDPVSRINCKGEQLALSMATDPSPFKKMDGTNHHASMGTGEGEVWGTTMDITPIKERDKLLSTNGMIQEFFGDANSGLSSLS